MKFTLVINMERLDPQVSMRDVAREVLEMVQMADAGGFEIAWSAEHHGIEMTVSPGPFQLLAWWAAHTSRIRLGTAVVVAPYWHPLKLAGEAALFDLLSGGRLEFGIGRGAYQREFDRLAGGLDQRVGVAYMQEMLPVLKRLWEGDYAHQGQYWSFPTATSVPKPLQKPHPRVWVAARDPGTFDWAIKNECSIMTWALSRPFAEVELYKERFETALKNNPGVKRPAFMTMRHTSVYERPGDWEAPVNSAMRQSGQFENLFKNLGGVANGFVETVDLAAFAQRNEFDPLAMKENLMFGTPDEVIAKLKRYEALGTDYFCYSSAFGQPMTEQKRSLALFIKEVMPAFAEAPAARPRAVAI